MRTMPREDKKKKASKKPVMNLPYEFETQSKGKDNVVMKTILDDIELPTDLINSYKELNERLEETISRIEKKRRSRRGGQVARAR